MDKSVVITGCNGLLGRELTKGFISEGWHVLGIDIATDDLPTRPGFDFILFDLNCITEYPFLIMEIEKRTSVLKCLVNNAARNPKAENIADFGTFSSFSTEEWEKDLHLNLTAPIFLIQNLMPVFSYEGFNNKIINMISTYGLVSPNPALYMDEKGRHHNKPISYSVSKAGLAMATKYLAAHFADKGFNINGVAPGGIWHEGLPNSFVAKYETFTPQKRMAFPKEIADAVLFLASEKTEYINGEILTVDGGWTIW